MFKEIKKEVWVFDVEWVPDPGTGKILYGLPESDSDEEVIQEMWKKGGASEEDPMPYLKTAICRIVSLSAVTRTVSRGKVQLHLISLPRDTKDPEQISEAHILDKFLNAIGSRKPQLVGYNSHSADLKIMIQRGIGSGIQAKGFCKRPNKPWEGVDYFARGGEWNIDLIEIIGGYGKSRPSLNEMAAVCGIPGKISGDGQQVAPMWLRGELDDIVAYNEFDALTTYLLWLRMAYFGGFFTAAQYENEQNILRRLLAGESEKPERKHLETYLAEWEKLRTGKNSSDIPETAAERDVNSNPE